MEDAVFLRKYIRTGTVDVHPTEKAIIVNYELQATILGELGDPLVGDKKECQKIIRLKDLSNTTNTSLLAQEIINKCKLISPSKLAEVEQLIYYLQNRKVVAEKNGTDKSVIDVLDELNSSSSEVKEEAVLTKLDSYIEFLYEDIPEKIRGTNLILQLARNPTNLEELLQNETLLGALARVLREDWKQSLELATNIVYTFFSFSTFSQFHSMISHFKVGSQCMDIIDFELKRAELLIDKSHESKLTQNENSSKKLQALIKRQEQLLRVCIYLLLNLAEDVKTEMKMVNRNITNTLCRIFERTESKELLVLDVTFLKKLSIFKENVAEMIKCNIVPRIVRMVGQKSDDLTNACLRLLFNLSFSSELREKMVTGGLVSSVASLLGNQTDGNLALTLQLLYHLSFDDKAKALFTYTDCVPVAIRLLFAEQSSVVSEASALLANLAINKRNAQLLCCDDGQGLKSLMRRAFKFHDPLTLKIVRNIAMHDGPTKALLVEYVCDLASAIKSPTERQEFSIECVGILSSLALPDLDFARLLDEYDLVDWLAKMLKPGECQDDYLLELVMLIGTLASDPAGAQLTLTKLAPGLVALLSAKQEDDEIVLQIIYVFYRMLLLASVSSPLIKDTEITAYLIDLMHDKNTEIRKLCDLCLELVSEHSDEWSSKIKEEKFRWHNAQWLEMVGQNLAENLTTDDEDDLNFGINTEDDDPFKELYASDVLSSSSDRPASRMETKRIAES